MPRGIGFQPMIQTKQRDGIIQTPLIGDSRMWWLAQIG
jgi:hypothetical protein